MPRTRYQRDFRDLHGHDPGVVELTPEPESGRARWASPRPRTGFAYAMPLWARLGLAGMGLFWGLVLGAAAVAAIAGLGVFVWGLFAS